MIIPLKCVWVKGNSAFVTGSTDIDCVFCGFRLSTWRKTARNLTTHVHNYIAGKPKLNTMRCGDTAAKATQCWWATLHATTPYTNIHTSNTLQFCRRLMIHDSHLTWQSHCLQHLWLCSPCPTPHADEELDVVVKVKVEPLASTLYDLTHWYKLFELQAAETELVSSVMTPDTVLLSLAAANKSISQTNIKSNLQSQVNLEPEKLDHTPCIAHAMQCWADDSTCKEQSSPVWALGFVAEVWVVEVTKAEYKPNTDGLLLFMAAT